MAWTSPVTFVANAVLTAAQLNTNLRDNLNETAPGKATTAGSIFVATGSNAIAERIPATATVATSETTTSTTYTDLATSGPAVTVTTGTKAIVGVYGWLSNNTAGQGCHMSHAVSGASALSAVDTGSASIQGSANDLVGASGLFFRTDLTAGSNVFTAKYRVGGGTGTFNKRMILVIPL